MKGNITLGVGSRSTNASPNQQQGNDNKRTDVIGLLPRKIIENLWVRNGVVRIRLVLSNDSLMRASSGRICAAELMAMTAMMSSFPTFCFSPRPLSLPLGSSEIALETSVRQTVCKYGFLFY